MARFLLEDGVAVSIASFLHECRSGKDLGPYKPADDYVYIRLVLLYNALLKFERQPGPTSDLLPKVPDLLPDLAFYIRHAAPVYPTASALAAMVVVQLVRSHALPVGLLVESELPSALDSLSQKTFRRLPPGSQDPPSCARAALMEMNIVYQQDPLWQSQPQYMIAICAAHC